MHIGELLEEQKIFETNKVPRELKYIGIAMYFWTCSLRKTARILLEIYPVSRSAVWRWVRKVESKMPISTEKKKHRDIVLIDDTVVKSNGLQCYVYSAIDKERNEVVLMVYYPSSKIDFAEYYFVLLSDDNLEFNR